jgi:hypothetical protein
MTKAKVQPQEAFLKKGSMHCTNPVCKAPLHFEVLGMMRVKRQHEDGRWYYSARCSCGRCGQSFKVDAPADPVYKDDTRTPPAHLVKFRHGCEQCGKAIGNCEHTKPKTTPSLKYVLPETGYRNRDFGKAAGRELVYIIEYRGTRVGFIWRHVTHSIKLNAVYTYVVWLNDPFNPKDTRFVAEAQTENGAKKKATNAWRRMLDCTQKLV